MKRVKVFCVSGFSGSGKTTLIESLTRKLTKKGKSITVVKSSREDIGPPVGTDTYRHLGAGAESVAIIGPSTTTIRYQERLSPEELFSKIESDYVLLEGFKTANIPKVFCIGKGEIIQEDIPNGSLAIVRWKIEEDAGNLSLPVLSQDDLDGIINLIEQFSITSDRVKF